MLADIKDQRIQRSLLDRADKLANQPEQQGKALRNELRGCWSVRAVGQRYRIVYRILEAQRTVQVLGLGLRKEGDKRDIYMQLARLLRQESRS